jgi:glycosyltransferase involved in cell wall biosynthesis
MAELKWQSMVLNLRRDLNATNRELGFVCIAGFNRENIYYLKGLDLICKIAPHFPQYPFTIVGAKGKYVNYPVPENVKILPFIHEDEKIAILNKYRFYFQLSLSEGFPNALCEAMVNGMIAIVSDVCSMPDIVNGAGFVLKHRDEKELIALIETILLEDLDQLSLKNAEKIRSHYPPQNRKKRLLEIIKS